MTSNYLFHGTCLKNAKSILEHGFDGEMGEQIWNVSGGANYFWSVKDLIKAGECDCGEDAAARALEFAKEAGETALIQNDCNKIVVFQIRAAGVDYEPDQSCENMGGAVVSYDSISPDQIEKVWISDDLTYFKPFMLASTMAWNKSLRIQPEVPEVLNRMAEAVKDVTFYYSEYIELEETSKENIF
jgi:hypothetical protein